MVSKIKIKKLRDGLPKGYARVIRERLCSAGIEFSEDYIYQCLNPDSRKYSLLVVEEAIKVRDEYNDKIKDVENKI